MNTTQVSAAPYLQGGGLHLTEAAKSESVRFVGLEQILSFKMEVTPDTGSTMLVQTTDDSLASINAGTAVWDDWPVGSTPLGTTGYFFGALTSIKVTGSGSFELWGSQQTPGVSITGWSAPYDGVKFKSNPVTGEIELSAGEGPITVGGGGITPDATGTLAGRAAHNAEAVGFAYLATDQTPAEYYFREGSAGNWSPAVTIRGPTGAQGIPGEDGAGGFALPSTVVTSVANTATSTMLLIEGGVAEQISVDSLIAAISIPASDLSAAAALSGSNIVTLSQDGGATEVRTTLAALATFFGAIQSTTVPGAPTAVTATAGNASASVAFTAPASNGGSAITGYTVTSSPGGFTGTGAASPITVSGLTNGTAYTFTAVATNAVGSGAASSASSAVTPSAGASAPAQVTGLTLGIATSTTQPLSWTAPSNGGSAITDYVVQRSLAGANSWTTFADGTSTTTSTTVTGLTASTSYDYRVAAVNAIGTGTNSAISTGSTAAAGTSYTIGGYAGNATKTAVDATAFDNTYLPLRRSPGGATDLTTLSSHWEITPDPVSCRGGWGTSNTVPPAEISAGQNGSGAASVNGLLPMGKAQPNTWDTDGYFWVTAGSGTVNYYLWIKPVDGVAQCMNPSAPLVVSNC